jgi:hypothetical protein
LKHGDLPFENFGLVANVAVQSCMGNNIQAKNKRYRGRKFCRIASDLSSRNALLSACFAR